MNVINIINLYFFKYKVSKIKVFFLKVYSQETLFLRFMRFIAAKLNLSIDIFYIFCMKKATTASPIIISPIHLLHVSYIITYFIFLYQ